MNILINTSNIHVGGGLQVAISIVEEAKNLKNSHKYVIVASPEVYESISATTFDDRFVFYRINSTGLPFKRSANKILNEAVRKEEIDIVFSIFGPTYWSPKVPHIMGFAVPELIYPDSKVFSLHPWATRIKKRIELKIKKFYVKQDADFYWTETEDCKERMYKYLVNRKKPIQVIGNTYSHYYRQSQDSKKKILPEKPANSIRFITISANYVHKNLSIIREVSLELEKLKIDHEFVVTIPKEEFDVLFDGAKNVKTVGRVLPSKCPQLYKESDFVFLPTLLECFTANYPEGMIMGKPILTTNYSFAKDLCREAAVYFDPMDKKDIVACIRNLLKDPLKQEKLIEAGLERVKDFPTALERAQNVINLCEKYGNQS